MAAGDVIGRGGRSTGAGSKMRVIAGGITGNVLTGAQFLSPVFTRLAGEVVDVMLWQNENNAGESWFNRDPLATWTTYSILRTAVANQGQLQITNGTAGTRTYSYAIIGFVL